MKSRSSTALDLIWVFIFFLNFYCFNKFEFPKLQMASLKGELYLGDDTSNFGEKCKPQRRASEWIVFARNFTVWRCSLHLAFDSKVCTANFAALSVFSRSSSPPSSPVSSCRVLDQRTLRIEYAAPSNSDCNSSRTWTTPLKNHLSFPMRVLKSSNLEDHHLEVPTWSLIVRVRLLTQWRLAQAENSVSRDCSACTGWNPADRRPIRGSAVFFNGPKVSIGISSWRTSARIEHWQMQLSDFRLSWKTAHLHLAFFDHGK